MQRRKVDALASSSSSSSLPISSAPGSASANLNRGGSNINTSSSGAGNTSKSRKRGASSNNLLILLAIVVVLMALITLLSPNGAKEIVRAEHRVEEWLQHQQQVPPIPAADHEDMGAAAPSKKSKTKQIDASRAMARQSSRWVDGEKKLKSKLKVLAERQSKGQDLGVPILTRWLGEDFPAWVAEGEDKEAWETKRKAEYERMKQEEERWRAQVRKDFLGQGDNEEDDKAGDEKEVEEEGKGETA